MRTHIQLKRSRASAVSRLFYAVLLPLLLPTTLPADSPNFEDHVLPIFRQHCTGCHNPDRNTADLDLTTYRGVLKGSSGGPVVKAGVPDTSSLYEAITHADGVKAMPRFIIHGMRRNIGSVGRTNQKKGRCFMASPRAGRGER